MKLIEDKNNKIGKHIRKNEWWKAHGIEVERIALPVGDYILVDDKVQDVIDRKAKRGIEVSKMDLIGSYKVCVDSKRDIEELVSDCISDHSRFRDELILAQNNGIKLYIVVENKGKFVDSRKTIFSPDIRRLEDLHKWLNPRTFIWRGGKQLYPSATRGIQLQKICYTMQQKYGCEFRFCSPEDSARLITDLLLGGTT